VFFAPLFRSEHRATQSMARTEKAVTEKEMAPSAVDELWWMVINGWLMVISDDEWLINDDYLVIYHSK
jgi:hypothetical protein